MTYFIIAYFIMALFKMAFLRHIIDSNLQGVLRKGTRGIIINKHANFIFMNSQIQIYLVKMLKFEIP